jgi:hypothetical protein
MYANTTCASFLAIDHLCNLSFGVYLSRSLCQTGKSRGVPGLPPIITRSLIRCARSSLHLDLKRLTHTYPISPQRAKRHSKEYTSSNGQLWFHNSGHLLGVWHQTCSLIWDSPFSPQIVKRHSKEYTSSNWQLWFHNCDQLLGT